MLRLFPYILLTFYLETKASETVDQLAIGISELSHLTFEGIEMGIDYFTVLFFHQSKKQLNKELLFGYPTLTQKASHGWSWCFSKSASSEVLLMMVA